ncbi:hypothetical protein MPSEU_000840500 [Mayamaea pseudoterrestris]|nr:hypothetical protein MPSEU_000840500 [Mayamaea pseudoterrestris]
MIHHWTACLFIWTLAFACGFSHPLVAQQGLKARRHQGTLGLLIRGGQQGEEAKDMPSSHKLQHRIGEDSQIIKSSAPVAAMTTALGSFARFYEGSLARRPIVTKSLTAGFIFGLSDLLAQKIESRDSSKTTKSVSQLDWSRILASAAVGLFYFGPAAHYWYNWVFSILPGTSLASTLQKAALGQLIFGPCFTCIYFGVGLAQSGKFTLSNWVTKVRQDLFGAWLAGTSFWPLVDIISYSLVPKTYIPLFVNMCSLVWTIYLSLLSNRSAKAGAA